VAERQQISHNVCNIWQHRQAVRNMTKPADILADCWHKPSRICSSCWISAAVRLPARRFCSVSVIILLA